MVYEYSRLELLVGEKKVEELGKARVAIFGIGGAGSYAAEALARCGIGVLTLIDYDVVSITNVNREITALHSTVGKLKTKVMKERINDIDPDILVHTYETFFSKETQQLFDFKSYDYIVDAMDNLESKILLIEKARAEKIDIISCMDLGDKMNPSRLEITDIAKTGICPMARVVRTELKKKKIRRVKVLYSREFPVRNVLPEKKDRAGSISFISGIAGMMMAGEVVRDLIKKK